MVSSTQHRQTVNCKLGVSDSGLLHNLWPYRFFNQRLILDQGFVVFCFMDCKQYTWGACKIAWHKGDGVQISCGLLAEMLAVGKTSAGEKRNFWMTLNTRVAQLLTFPETPPSKNTETRNKLSREWSLYIYPPFVFVFRFFLSLKTQKQEAWHRIQNKIAEKKEIRPHACSHQGKKQRGRHNNCAKWVLNSDLATHQYWQTQHTKSTKLDTYLSTLVGM